jgi:hypothetical protein
MNQGKPKKKLFSAITGLIEESRECAFKSVNSEMIRLYWNILKVCKIEWKTCNQILIELGVIRNREFKESMVELLGKKMLRYLYPKNPKSRYQKYKTNDLVF